MVLVQLPTVLLRVSQSKVRSDHDEWHDVQIPHLEGPPLVDKSGSSNDEVDSASASFVSEHEVCYHLCCDKDPVDCVEVLHTCSGIGAYLSHQGKSVAPAVDWQFTNKKSLQQSIAAAWKNLVRYDSSLVILHAVTPKDFSMRKEFWSFCTDVTGWQTQRGKHWLVIAPNTSPLWSSRSSRTLCWMSNMYSVGNQSSDGSAYMATNLPSGWMKRLVDNLPVLHEGTSYDSKFVTLLASCLQGEPSCDARQVFLFEDLLEDADDGLLRSLSLRHDRCSLGDTIFPHVSLISKMKPLSDKLPVGHRYVLPQRFVTSSLIQSLKKVDSTRPGVEVEINSSTDDIARELRPLMQNVSAKQIRRAKLEEFKSYLDNGVIRFLDNRTLKFGPGGTNYLTGRWVLTVKVNKDGNFSKFKARWVCKGFQDKHGWEQQSDSPTASLSAHCQFFVGFVAFGFIAPDCHYSTS